MDANVVLNAYIDLNLLIIAGLVIWLSLRWGLSKSRFGLNFIRQQRVLSWMIAGLILAPLIADGVNGWLITGAPNLTDMLVAQYLNGNVGMSAQDFQGLLVAREGFERDLLSGQSNLSWMIGSLFLMGAAASLSFTLHAAYRLRQILKNAYVLRRIGRVEVLVSDTSRVAFSTRGILRRYVVLPSGMLSSGKDLRMVVAHELQHFRHRDVEVEFLFEAVRILLFWNPAFYLWRQEIRAMREYACDQALVQRRGFQARAYCECLIRACESALKARQGVRLSTPSVGLVDLRNKRRGATLRRRIEAATAQRNGAELRLGWEMLSLALVSAIFVAALLIQRPADWSHDRIMLSTIVNLERMAARETETLGATLVDGFVFDTY